MSDWITTVAGIRDSGELSRFLASSSIPGDAPALLHEAVLAALYVDRDTARALSQAAAELAHLRATAQAHGFALRCRGHISYIDGDYESAAASYQEAAALFEQTGAPEEVGRTLLSGLQSLSYLGRYAQVEEWAERAESIFVLLGDALRLARLDTNVGNILFRQDQPRSALARYQRALDGLLQFGNAKDVAAVLSNLAVCHTSLGQFTEAYQAYERARRHCEEHSLGALAAQADYNVAYLYFLRGDYAEARARYRHSRERCRAAGDLHHEALCDLDEGELCIELNLFEESAHLLRRAVRAFQQLGMRYEQAKALLNLSVIASQRSCPAAADRRLKHVRRLFAREGNLVWGAITDQLRAVLAFHSGRLFTAQRLSESAWKTLTRTMVPGRAAHSQILLARLWLKAGNPDRARAVNRQAIESLGDALSPSLRFHSLMVEGEIYEMQGRRKQAIESYQAARREVEDLRRRVDSDDLRISVLTDKLAVYESLVAIHFESPASDEPGDVLTLVQEAKSRSLADRLFAGWTEAAGNAEPLRHDLDGIYRQLGTADLKASARNPGETRRALSDRAREIESSLSPSYGTAGVFEPVPTAALNASLLPRTALLEYFEARGILYLLIFASGQWTAIRLGPSTPVSQALKLLHFQLRRFQIRCELGLRDNVGREVVAHHLRELYGLLIAPVLGHLRGYEHLVIAPHRRLHNLPFAALLDGDRALIEKFTLCVIPSARVLAGSQQRIRKPASGALVMAVPDRRAPQIRNEAKMVSSLLSGAELLTGKRATTANFRASAPGRSILHVAAHGDFRADNPMFSSLHFSDGPLLLADIISMSLDIDLLTLSACNSGSSVAVAADELLGLMRGFLTAGVRSLLLTLWEVNDNSTNEFMTCFYRSLHQVGSAAEALREAVLTVKKSYDHPYYWAPFILVGQQNALQNQPRTIFSN